MAWSAAELLDALRRRRMRGRSLRPDEQPLGLSPEWQSVITARQPTIFNPANAWQWRDAFLDRPLRAPPRRSAPLTDPQILRAMLRQRWDAPTGADEERGLRRAAAAFSVGVHVLLLLLLGWLLPEPLPSEPDSGEDVVQIEYIGTATPELAGGGEPAAKSEPAPETAPTPTEAADAPASATATPLDTPAAAAASALPSTASAPQPSDAPIDMLAQETVPTPPSTPLQVTESKLPDPVFAVPPPQVRPPTLAEPTLQAPDLAAQVKPVEVVETAPLQGPTQPVRVALPSATPSLREPATQAVREIEVKLPAAAPAAAPATPTSTAATAGSSSVRAPTSAASSGRAAKTTSPTPGQGAASSAATAQGPKPAPGQTPSPGAGPKPVPAAGGLPSPQRGDDWGVGQRNTPGGNAGHGLFTDDGRPKLGEGRGVASNYPPGYDAWGMDRVDRNGTWLKRPPPNYRGTRFDAYWIPSGTLLQQWVRSGVKTMEITIPGTSKKITCVVSLLMLGGACGVSDPNMRDEEAIARPPPAVPFKRDLFEDQGALGPPSAPTPSQGKPPGSKPH